MDKFQNRYRIPSARAPWWDYGRNASYFITICTQGRAHFLGEIHTGQFRPTASGQVAHSIWMEIPAHYPFIKLGAFVVMPNHIHGIVIIDNDGDGDGGGGGDGDGDGDGRIAINRDSTGGITGRHNPMLHKNLPRIVRWYKGRVSFECRKTQPEFAWQSRYHDHIIRNDAEYQRIHHYIENNPANWREDKFHK